MVYRAGSVPGQSSVNFIFNLMEAHEGGTGGYSLKEGRPLTGETSPSILGTKHSFKEMDCTGLC